MFNILTFDIEDWYHAKLVHRSVSEWQNYKDRVVEPTLKILKLLSRTNNKATFFVLGYVAEMFPELVQKITNEGHEVASHSYGHQLIYNLNEKKFTEDLKRSKNIIEDILGEQILGYRAPSWSFNESTAWVWNILYENGFRYDSSLFPFKVFLYGSNSHPRFLHQKEIEQGKVIFEIPPSVIERFGKRIPCSGGFYFRTLPYWFIRFALNCINKKEHQPAVVYLHPWEIDLDQPRFTIGLRNRFIQYHNLNKTEIKLKHLLNEFKFTSIKDYLLNKGLLTF